MIQNVLEALGGIGLFLVGMVMLTDGLRGLAGQRLRDFLRRFTATPLSGALTGAGVTALIQSSSATTLMAVGFVGAGVLTFPQALGVIFGANIGTTVTGWLVAILGFKLDLGEVVLPLVLVGALLRLLGNRKMATLGSALAGFSLLFIGIEVMKEGLAAFQGVLAPEDFPPDTVLGRLQLVGIGVAITLITQSSSAGVALVLVAVGAGTINFSQAAALVIGMDVGTTFTAVMATLGGTATTRRTGYAHVVYNLMTATVAFVLLPAAVWLRTALGQPDVQISLVAFHTAFNALGVMMVLPFANQFAYLIERLVPEKGSVLTRRLDKALLKDRVMAIEAAGTTVVDLADAVRAKLLSRMGGATAMAVPDTGALADAIGETRGYIESIPGNALNAADSAQLYDMIHILDHLGRLLYRCGQEPRIAALGRDRRLRRLRRTAGAIFEEAPDPANPKAREQRLNRWRQLLRRQRRHFRDQVISEAATGRLAPGELGLRLDAMRWLHRTAYHLWRVQVHLGQLEPHLPRERTSAR